MTRTLDMTKLEPITDDRLGLVIDAISALTDEDAVLHDAIGDLNLLSAATVFEGVDASPDGVFAVAGTSAFEATATIYVTLQYGGRKDEVAMSGAYPATIEGHFDKKNAVIDVVRVDTRSFYE